MQKIGQYIGKQNMAVKKNIISAEWGVHHYKLVICC